MSRARLHRAWDGCFGRLVVSERPQIGRVVNKMQFGAVEVLGRRVEDLGGVGRGAEQRSHAVRVGPLFQVVNQFGGGRVAVVRLLGHHLAHDGGEFARHVLGDFLQRLRVFHAVAVNLAHHVAAGKRRASRDRKIKRAAQRIDVASHIGLFVRSRLFRRDVVHRADDRARPGQLLLFFLVPREA